MKKLLLAGLVAGSLIAGTGSALANGSLSGSYEGRESEPYACPTEANPSPGGPAYDDAGDCEQGESTYTVWAYDNEVQCDGGPRSYGVAGGTALVDVFAGGEEGRYGAETCSDDGNLAPIEGRVLAEGGTGGVSVAVDGDASNPEQTRGWIRADAGSDGAGVRCGDTDGNLDSQTPSDDDTLEDCDPSA